MAKAPHGKADLSSSAARTGTPKVAVVYTRPESVLEDFANAMRLADCESYLSKDLTTLLKINISWQHYYPACSTTPWQLEGVIKALQGFGFGELIPTHNGTVVVDAREGAFNNKHQAVEEKYGLDSLHLEETRWIDFRPKSQMLVLCMRYIDWPAQSNHLKVKMLAEMPSAEGYMATCEKSAEGGYLLIENHCPICAAASECQGFCRSELEVFRRALGNKVRVERRDYLLDGAR